jgi:hypothetical protein
MYLYLHIGEQITLFIIYTHFDMSNTYVLGQTTIYKTLHRKLKIEQHEPHKNQQSVIMFNCK